MQRISRTALAGLGVAGAVGLGARAAAADPWWDWDEASHIGVMVGGGVQGFTEKTMRDTAKLAGAWDARLDLGVRMPVSLELGYLGSAGDLAPRFGAGPSTTLIGTTVEGDLRLNFMPYAPSTPYLFAGAGWQRWDVTNDQGLPMSVTGERASDDQLEIPVGAGLSWYGQGFLADVRGTVRFMSNPRLVQSGVFAGDYVPMHTWGVLARVGFEM